MARVKRGTTSVKRRKNILKLTKGYRFGRSTKEREAKQALIRAGQHALAHRRAKKGEFRALWNTKISAGTKELGLSYSKFIDALKKKNIGLDRKILSQLAEAEPETFKYIVEEVKK